MRKRFHDFAGTHESAHRHTTAHSFAHHQNIRQHSIMFKSKQFSGPAEARLYFIQNEQCTHFLAAFFQPRKIIRVRHQKARSSLNGFSNDTGSFFRDFGKLVCIIELNKIHQRQQRPKLTFVQFIPGYRQSTVGITVVGLLHRNNFFAAGVTLCQFQRTINRFRTRIYKIRHF